MFVLDNGLREALETLVIFYQAFADDFRASLAILQQ